MPVIPEGSEMDQFVDWDQADPAVGASFDLIPLPDAAAGANDADDMRLFFENVEGDDFSFWALEHYEQSNLVNPVDMATDGVFPGWELPGAPCTNCQKGGFQCKTIREGSYRGYCTSCVALRCECSFGLAAADEPASATFPSNPWPTLGDHPNTIPHEDGTVSELPRSASIPDLKGPAGEPSAGPNPGPKIGARFSRESVKILKNWLSIHSRHPYPTEDEKFSLQRLTGLDKTQIANWLANARRRKKYQPPRSTSPQVKSWSGAIDIPPRRGTPGPTGSPFESMNPLQRWANSPPENEPASVTDIARAINSSSSAVSSGLDSPHSYNYTDDGSGRSLCHGSSATSSVGTSGSSGGSFASAYSHASRGSFGSFGSLNRGRRRRRRRTVPPKPDDGPTSLAVPLKTFQCTFCTETFRTKHDWQRHEKSLHLSLERWVCAPKGPTALKPESKQACCVFCGHANPDEAHVESHNYSACQERTLVDRTFYRKDHLRQHLKLVHDVKFVGWSMDPWKVATPEIRSRCGFCGIVMDTWTIRVDHLAEHFKTGNTMADWKGDWGFDAPVLEMVENSIPPYLIHDERNSPLPFAATGNSPETPRNAYELLKSELVYFVQNQRDAGRNPSDEELQFEACRIVFGCEVLSSNDLSSTPSWVRDLVMSSPATTLRAQLSPIRSQADSRQSVLKINGKDNIFEQCALESQLREFVRARGLLGLTAMDEELQIEACKIIGRMEESCSSPSEDVANFLLRLIFASKTWLADFRRRTQLPRSEDLADESLRSKDPSTIDSTIHNYSRLETELAEYVRSQMSLGIVPDDASLQKQARTIIYEFDDGWNQTAADSAEWLTAFRDRHMGEPFSSPLSAASTAPVLDGRFCLGTAEKGAMLSPLDFRSKNVRASRFFLNDTNCYRRLARELTRYVHSAMSSNNPNRHVPSDEELQHQSRWILYDDDDPWNRTAADNAEWLLRFKRDSGILPAVGGPGLPDATAWAIRDGGSGFAPPYTFPQATMSPIPTDGAGNVKVRMRDEGPLFPAEPSTANKFLQSFTSRFPAPATVFCSRELESGLEALVQSSTAAGEAFPSDDVLQAKAREIIGMEKTAADDEVLLGKFKDMVKAKTAAGQPAIQTQTIPEVPDVDAMDTLPYPTESEMNDILQSMDFDFVEAADLDVEDDARRTGELANGGMEFV